MKSQIFAYIFLSCAIYAVTGQGSMKKSGKSDPCKSLGLDCIRDYFAKSGLCNKVSHSDGRTIQEDTWTGYLPSFNTTVLTTDDAITFYGSSIETFHISSNNDLVMAVKFDGMHIYTPKGKLVIHERASEPVVVEDFLTATYSAVLTAIFPQAGQNGVSKSYVSAFNTNPYPPFAVGPNIAQSSNPAVMKTYAALLGALPTAVNELLLTKGPFFFYAYLQNYICDFGFNYTGGAMV